MKIDVGSDKVRAIQASPPSFQGTLATFYQQYCLQHLPEPEIVEYYHRLLVEYCRDGDPLFVVRYLPKLTNRGQTYRTNGGHRFVAGDNSPAWWMHALLFHGIRLDAPAFAQAIVDMPMHIFSVKRHVAKTINDAGWHVAHIFSVKDGNTNYANWDRPNLVQRFIRNVHPCNSFYIAKNRWQQYGGDLRVIEFFTQQNAHRYGNVWDEFCSLAKGTHALSHEDCGMVQYVYGPTKDRASKEMIMQSAPNTETSLLDPQLRYESTRLRFKAKAIKKLEPHQAFRIDTPNGSFQMTKAQFCDVFDNVVRSEDYINDGVYSYTKIPEKAQQFRVDE